MEEAIRQHREFIENGSPEDPWIEWNPDEALPNPVGLPADGPKKMPLRKNKAVGARVQYPKRAHL